MFKALIGRELLDTLMTFRFAAVSLITLLLVVANTAVLLQEYEQRLGRYHDAVEMHRRDFRKAETYSTMMLFADRAPNPLSIFNVGLDKRLGNLVGIYHGFVPTLWISQMHGTDNPFIAFFSAIDVVFVFEVILSLMGLLFAYDAIAGERERGTLRLVFAHSLGRGQFLLAKYISAMACLCVPLIVSLLFAVVLLTRVMPVAAADLLRIGGIVLTSLAYLSVFYLLGLLLSVVTRRTSTALMLAMFVWGFLLLIYPNLIRAGVSSGADSRERMKTAETRIQRIIDAYEKERTAFLENGAVIEDAAAFREALGIYADAHVDSGTLSPYLENMSFISEIPPDFEKYVPMAKRYYTFVEPLAADAAERAWRIQKETLDAVFVQQAVRDRMLLKLSPVGIYDAATQAWAGTDLQGVQDFFQAARRYRRVVINYLHAKDAFGAREWFVADKGAVDWSTFPEFSFERADIEVNAKRALPDLLLLVMWNLVLFMSAVFLFMRNEI